MTARDNPFATDRTERLLYFRPEWMGASMSELTNRWEKLDRRAEILGRHGAGKSTLLATWKQHLESEHQPVIDLFLNRESNGFNEAQWQKIEACHGKTIILDGEEQLSWRQRHRFYQLTKHAVGILVTRHKKGRLPTLCHLDPGIETLHRCIQELAPEHYPSLSPLLPKWWKQYRGNIREILLRCYDEVTHEAA